MIMVPNKDYIDKWDLSFTKWKDAKSVGVLQDEEQVKIVAQYKHPLTGVYYITEEDFNKDAFVGYNCVDLKKYVEPVNPKEEEPIKPEEPNPTEPKQKDEIPDVSQRDESGNALLWLVDCIVIGCRKVKNFIVKIFTRKK